jgi:hypothetical protein
MWGLWSVYQGSGSAQGTQPSAKKPRLDEVSAKAKLKQTRLVDAKARMKGKKQAARRSTLMEIYGVTTEHGKRAITAGFKKADMTAYNRNVTEQSARNYTDAAGNHPFVKANGKVDMTAYIQNVSQKRQEDDAVSALLAMSAL